MLRPEPRRFLVAGIGLGVIAPLFLWKVGSGGLGMLFAMGALIIWLLFRDSTLTLDDEGFTYHSAARRISHRWVDIERFCVVEQRMFFFITTNRYLGWNFTPAYKNYKRLAIPRTVARWVGMTDAMFKPVGFNVPEVTKIMNEHLLQSRTRPGLGR